MDLHNHLGYQLQLPESIAVVYSPIATPEKVRFFRIKDDQVGEIASCQRGEGFHNHGRKPASNEECPPLFEDCTHIVLVNALDFAIKVDIADLRS